ncbi:MAG: aminoglycoside phosphotransferase family protein [Rhodobacterales bacterium]|nr:aminoglycoside phosphotransferase family protein [Puniceibacterium antarcticum]
MLENRLKDWSLRLLAEASSGATASVYKVAQPTGNIAALKIYPRGHAGNEIGAAPYLRALATRGVSKVLAVETDALLTQWLDGPPLSDLSGMSLRSADQRLAWLALDLLAAPRPKVILPPLSDWLADALDRLARLAPSDNRSCLVEVVGRGQRALAHALDQQPLHGDLHHGNIVITTAGPKAIDAKGVIGPKPYELANALRHPSATAPVCGTALAERLAFFATTLDIPPTDLAFWTAIKTALSIVWRGTLSSAADRRDMQRMRACLELCP